MQIMTEPLLCTLLIDAASMPILEKNYLEFHPNNVTNDPHIDPTDEKVGFGLEQSPGGDGTCQSVTKTFNTVFLLVLNPLNWEKLAVISAFHWRRGHANNIASKD